VPLLQAWSAVYQRRHQSRRRTRSARMMGVHQTFSVYLPCTFPANATARPAPRFAVTSGSPVPTRGFPAYRAPATADTYVEVGERRRTPTPAGGPVGAVLIAPET